MKTKQTPLFYLLFFIILALLCTWTDRNLDFWLSYFKGSSVDCPLWLSIVATILAPITITLNIIGEIARLIV